MTLRTKLLLTFFLMNGVWTHAQVYKGTKGTVKLTGEAPQETITAESSTLAGVIDLTSKKFNFKQPMNTFTFSQGDLQKKHAEETFWEVTKYPFTTFTGEITNDTNLTKEGIYQVTVRGILNLHGVEKELKIPALLVVQNGTTVVTSKFSVFLSDHDIKIPRLVVLKVAPEFTVDIQLKLSKL